MRSFFLTPAIFRFVVSLQNLQRYHLGPWVKFAMLGLQTLSASIKVAKEQSACESMRPLARGFHSGYCGHILVCGLKAAWLLKQLFLGIAFDVEKTWFRQDSSRIFKGLIFFSAIESYILNRTPVEFHMSDHVSLQPLHFNRRVKLEIGKFQTPKIFSFLSHSGLPSFLSTPLKTDG